MRKKRVEKEFYEKVCAVCGTPFIAKHGNKRICPECVEVLHGNKGRHLPRQYETPVDLEQYEAGVRSRYIALQGHHHRYRLRRKADGGQPEEGRESEDGIINA